MDKSDQWIPVIRGTVVWRRWQLFLLALGVAAAFRLDRSFDAVQRLPKNHWLAHVAGKVSQYADFLPMVILAASLILLCALLKKQRWQRALALALLSGILAGGAADALRFLTGRTRPNAEMIQQGWYGLWHGRRWIAGQYDFSSFPSGHTALVAGAFAFLWFVNRRWGGVGLGIVPLVGWSRLYLGCHHFSDVLVSALIGVAGAYFIWWRTVQSENALAAGAPAQFAPDDSLRPTSPWRRVKHLLFPPAAN